MPLEVMLRAQISADGRSVIANAVCASCSACFEVEEIIDIDVVAAFVGRAFLRYDDIIIEELATDRSIGITGTTRCAAFGDFIEGCTFFVSITFFACDDG